MKQLGVIGGLGPIATAYFMEQIITMTDADTDQEHLDMIIYNYPSTPDRTSFILGKSEKDPRPAMINVAKKIDSLGVDYLTIPCITAHTFYDDIQKEVKAPIIHIVKETVKHLKDNGIERVGIMATDGTITSGLFQKELLANNMFPIIPTPISQKKVMDLIYKDVKANKSPEMDKFFQVSGELRDNGAEAIILGCTELSIIKRDENIGAGFIDAMEVLAMRSICLCDAKLNKKYKSLITK